MHNYMCPTNSVFVSLEENEKYSVIQAIWRHARLDSQTREDINWKENGQFAVADQQKTTHRTWQTTILIRGACETFTTLGSRRTKGGRGRFN